MSSSNTESQPKPGGELSVTVTICDGHMDVAEKALTHGVTSGQLAYALGVLAHSAKTQLINLIKNYPERAHELAGQYMAAYGLTEADRTNDTGRTVYIDRKEDKHD